jgi:hypothetical protein
MRRTLASTSGCPTAWSTKIRTRHSILDQRGRPSPRNIPGNQTMRQAARLAASQAYAKRRRERAQRDRRLEKLAIEVLTALGERDATTAATEQRAAPRCRR